MTADLAPDRAPPLIGEAPIFLDALARISAAAPLDRPLLIVGERGAGKELFAARAHFLSQRWDQPLVTVNCAALSEDLLESELFGHEAGAFTGAAGRRLGKFERADRGTLFLDEIASASLRVQEKILRAIEYGQFERLGAGETLKTDVRVVAAANIDLPDLAARGAFRADLLDRLAFDVVTAPPLRARREDIPVLAAHFATAMAHEMNRDPFAGFSPDAMRTLIAHDWPGNVRELKNTVERAVYRHFVGDADAEARVAEIILDPFASPYRPAPATRTRADPVSPAPPHAARASAPSAEPPDRPMSFTRIVANFETELLRRALAANGGNQKRTAAELDLSYDQLRGLVRKYGLAKRRRA